MMVFIRVRSERQNKGRGKVSTLAHSPWNFVDPGQQRKGSDRRDRRARRRDASPRAESADHWSPPFLPISSMRTMIDSVKERKKLK